MSVLSDNLRILRGRKGFAQQKVASELEIGRERLKTYEEGRSDPPIDILKKLSAYYNISIDLLVSLELSKVDLDQLINLENNRIVLPITVDGNGNDMIEIIPHKAKAGYLSGYNDPEYIENLEKISLPFLTKGKYRAFPIEGDSMPPHKNDSIIIGKFIENFNDIKDNTTYIFITATDGIVYKRAKKIDNTSIQLKSDNPTYAPYEVKTIDIYELWEFAASIATSEFQPDDLSVNSIKTLLLDIRSALPKTTI